MFVGRIFLDHVYNFPYHLVLSALLLLHNALVVVRAEEIIPAEIAIQPHLHSALAVDAQHVLVRPEVTNQAVQLLKPEQR